MVLALDQPIVVCVSVTQIKEEDRFTAAPTFRFLMSRLLFRANILAEFFGSGMLYDQERSLPE